VGLRAPLEVQAYGLTAMPIGMIRGRKSNRVEEIEVQEDLASTRAQRQSLQSKVHDATTNPHRSSLLLATDIAADAAGLHRSRVRQYIGGRKINSTDQRSLDELERKERLLAGRSAVIDQEAHSWTVRFIACLRPFEV